MPSNDTLLRIQRTMKDEPRLEAGAQTRKWGSNFDHGILTARGGRREAVEAGELEHREIAHI